MIGAPTLDPRKGDRRNKALAQALAARASALSRTARTGLGRGARTGVGIRVANGGGRPSGILNFLSGKAPGGFGPGGVNFAAQAVNPAALVAAVQNPSGPLPGGNPLGGPPFTPQGPGVPLDQGGSYFDPNAPVGSPTGQTTGDAVEGNFENIWGFPTGSSGSGMPGIPGGLIPLGGGVYYDPNSGQLQGGGLL